MILPDNVPYEIDRAHRQAEAVTIYLDQQDHPVGRRLLQHKIQAICIYINELEKIQHDKKTQDQD